MKPHTMKHRTHVFVLSFLIIAGAAFAGVGLWIPMKAALAQILLEKAWQETRQGNSKIKAQTPAKPWPWADTWPVAKLTMGGESLYVLADAGGQSLAFGPSHVRGSAPPGTAGTSVIAAHRDTHFKPLRHVQLGDVVKIERPDGISHSYKIRRTRVLETSNLILPHQDGTDRVILVTCWPFDSKIINPKQRLAVLAERI